MTQQQFTQLINLLDDKITSLQTPRTDASTIGSIVSQNLQGYLSGLVMTMMQQSASTQQETGPRRIESDPIPLDIVSVSPRAADQILKALQAAGIGKYRLIINKPVLSTTTGSSGPGGSLALVAGVTAIVAWTSGTVKRLLQGLGDYVTGTFDDLTSWVTDIGSIVRDWSVKLFGENSSDPPDLERASIDQPGMFDSVVQDLDKLEKNPYSVFESPPVSTEELMQSDDFKNISGDTTDERFERWSMTPTGAEYTAPIRSELLDRADTTQTRVQKNAEQTVNKFIDMFQHGDDVKIKNQITNKFTDNVTSGQRINQQTIKDISQYLSIEPAKIDDSTQQKTIEDLNQVIAPTGTSTLLNQYTRGVINNSNYFNSMDFLRTAEDATLDTIHENLAPSTQSPASKTSLGDKTSMLSPDVQLKNTLQLASTNQAAMRGVVGTIQDDKIDLSGIQRVIATNTESEEKTNNTLAAVVQKLSESSTGSAPVPEYEPQHDDLPGVEHLRSHSYAIGKVNPGINIDNVSTV